jgi:pimeloyl-ACP methyl ester carboxylesterase
MPKIQTTDGVGLHVEVAGSGTPMVFVHEFAGDYRSWEPQIRYFARRYHVVTYSARGFPPSDVPSNPEQYNQARAAEDIRDVLDGLGIDKAHIVGLSMGGFATLHFGLMFPERALSLTVAGCGYGAEKDKNPQFKSEADNSAAKLRAEGMEAYAAVYAYGPTRVQFENKDPRGFAEFKQMLAEHSAEGSALTQLGVQRERPSLYDLEDKLKTLDVPTLVVTGDEDWPCLAPGIYLKQVIPTAGLLVVPNTGHTINLEEPAAFNAAVADFVAQVDAGRWPSRDPRAMSDSITGMK